jgi:hypothetical protein
VTAVPLCRTPGAPENLCARVFCEQLLIGMVGPARFERATLCLEGRCSIQLSYGPMRSFYQRKRNRERQNYAVHRRGKPRRTRFRNRWQMTWRLFRARPFRSSFLDLHTRIFPSPIFTVPIFTVPIFTVPIFTVPIFYVPSLTLSVFTLPIATLRSLICDL